MMENDNKERLHTIAKETSAVFPSVYTSSDSTISSKDTIDNTDTKKDLSCDAKESSTTASLLKESTASLASIVTQPLSLNTPLPTFDAQPQSLTTPMPIFEALPITSDASMPTFALEPGNSKTVTFVVFEPDTSDGSKFPQNEQRYTLADMPDGTIMAYSTTTVNHSTIPLFRRHSTVSQNVQLFSDENGERNRKEATEELVDKYASSAAEGSTFTEPNNHSSKQDPPFDSPASKSTIVSDTQREAWFVPYINFSQIALGNFGMSIPQNSTSQSNYESNSDGITPSGAYCEQLSSMMADQNLNADNSVSPIHLSTSRNTDGSLSVIPIYQQLTGPIVMTPVHVQTYEYRDTSHCYQALQSSIELFPINEQQSDVPVQLNFPGPGAEYVVHEYYDQQQACNILMDLASSTQDSSMYQYQTTEGAVLEVHASPSQDSSLYQHQATESTILEDHFLSFNEDEWRKYFPKQPWLLDTVRNLALENVEMVEFMKNHAWSKAFESAEAGSKAVGGSEAGSKAVGESQAGSKTVGASQAGNKTVGASQAGNKADGESEARRKVVGGSEAGSKAVGRSQAGNKAYGGFNAGSKAVGGSEVGSKAVGGSQAGSKDVGRSQAGNKADEGSEARSKVVGGSVVGRKAVERSQTRNKVDGVFHTGIKSVGGSQAGSKAVGSQAGNEAVGGSQTGIKAVGGAQVESITLQMKHAFIAAKAINETLPKAIKVNPTVHQYQSEVPNDMDNKAETLFLDLVWGPNSTMTKTGPLRPESKVNTDSKQAPLQSRLEQKRSNIRKPHLHESIPPVEPDMDPGPPCTLTSREIAMRPQTCSDTPIKPKKGGDKPLFAKNAATLNASCAVGSVSGIRMGLPPAAEQQLLPVGVLSSLNKNQKGVKQFVTKDSLATGIEKTMKILREIKCQPEPAEESASTKKKPGKNKAKNKKR